MFNLRTAIELTKRNNRDDRDDRRNAVASSPAFPAFAGGAGRTAEDALPGDEPAGAAAQLRSIPGGVALGARHGDISHFGPGEFLSARCDRGAETHLSEKDAQTKRTRRDCSRRVPIFV